MMKTLPSTLEKNSICLTEEHTAKIVKITNVLVSTFARIQITI